mmetsp:Transcript_12262/g.40267  ORF Transcript_12262/g.40267 Transcript_12262/m.40267 type:complete len:212 (+) Transcript_12262:14-649(+)
MADSQVDALPMLKGAEAVLSSLEAALKPVTGVAPRELEAELSDPADKADLHLTLARTQLSLFTLLLRVQGIDTSTHAVADEQKRIAMLEKRVKKAREASGPSRPAAQLDKASAGRFIAQALPAEQAERVRAAAGATTAPGPSSAAQAADDFLRGVEAGGDGGEAKKTKKPKKAAGIEAEGDGGAKRKAKKAAAAAEATDTPPKKKAKKTKT